MRVIQAAVIGIFLLTTALYAETNTIIRDIRYLNFDSKDNAQYTNWERRADFSQIEHWGNNRHLVALKDIYNIRDGKAAYVSPYGSEIKFSAMNPNAQYSLFIDFTVFRGGNDGILSKCVISADGRKLATVNFGEVPLDKPFELVLPRDLYYDGEVIVRFDEFATTPGVWGVWDMVLSAEGLPDKVITPVAEKPVIHDKAPSVAEPGKKPKRADKKADSGKDEAAKTPPVKKKVKEPEIIEPQSIKEPEIKQPEAKLPKEPGIPEIPLQKQVPDIRDSVK